LCRWHDPSPEARQRHREESRRGGVQKAYGELAAGAPLAEAVRDLDLGTPDGLRRLLAVVLRALAALPVDVRTCNSFAQLAGAQRSLIESSDVELRLRALEAAAQLRRIGG
jgi:hypothetical protein